MSTRPRPAQHRGFTLVELCIGMVITSMVAGAVGSFTLSVSSAWREAQASRQLAMRGIQVTARLHDLVQGAKLTGAFRPGRLDASTAPAALILWTADTNGDSLIQGAEVQLIAYDPASQCMLLYSGATSETATWSYSTAFSQGAVIDTFKLGRTPTVIARDVAGAAFSVSGTSGSANPTLNYALEFFVSDGTSAGHRIITQYGQATLRAPLAIPSN